jgi:hypothetical protein
MSPDSGGFKHQKSIEDFTDFTLGNFINGPFLGVPFSDTRAIMKSIALASMT